MSHAPLATRSTPAAPTEPTYARIVDVAPMTGRDTETLRRDAARGAIPARRDGRSWLVDVERTLAHYACGTPLATVVYTRFKAGVSPVDVVVDLGLDPALVERLWKLYVKLSRDPDVAKMRDKCSGCHRTEQQRGEALTAFALATTEHDTTRVSCCAACHVPTTWADEPRTPEEGDQAAE